MIWLGAVVTAVLFVLQIIGWISVSALVILTPLLVGICLTVVFWVVALIVGAFLS